MIISFLFDYICLHCRTMSSILKRRASKRFVLAESGQDDVAWDSTVDNSESQITISTSENNVIQNSEQKNPNLLSPGQMNQGLK